MTGEWGQRLLDLVDEALALGPGDRAAWLDRACADDARLRAEVEALLAVDEQTQGVLPAIEAATDLPHPAHGQDSGQPEHAGAPRVGHRLGDFLLEEQIGAGGMGVVYRARQVTLNRRVALKVLPAHLRFSPRAQARFRQEIEAAARLHHTNIVGVYTTGEADGTQFFAMELIDGPPLSRVIQKLRTDPVPELRSASTHARASGTTKSRTDHHEPPESAGPKSPDPIHDHRVDVPCDGDTVLEHLGHNYFDTVATQIADVADGLSFAHANGVIHRDVKPSNLLFSRDGRLHLSDFGLARMLEQPGVTQTGELVGTPFYMAPEQVLTDRGPIDGRTDIYALGATLYELLTLQPPFPGDSRGQVIAQIGRDEPRPPRRLNRRVPRDLETICLKALDTDPGRRYQTAGAMAADLRSYANRFAIAAKRAGPVSHLVKVVRRHPGLSFTLVAALCLAGAAAFFAVKAQRSETRWTTDQQNRVVQTALLAALQGDLDSAKRAVDETRRLDAPPGKVSLLEGMVALHDHQAADAYDHLHEAARLLPADLSARYLLVLACRDDQRPGEAESLEAKLHGRSPETLTDYLFKALVEKRHDPQRALATLNEAISNHKSNVATRLVRGDILASLAQESGDAHDAENALHDYAVASEFFGSDAFIVMRQLRAHLIAAVNHGLSGHPVREQDHRHNAAELVARLPERPGSIDVANARAYYFDYTGDLDQAVAERMPFADERIMHLVFNLFQQGRFGEAVALCEQRRAAHPGSRWTGFLLGLLNTVITDSPDSPEVAPGPEASDASGFLDPHLDHFFTFTLACLTDPAEDVRDVSRRFRDALPPDTVLNEWDRHLLSYTCGEVTEDELFGLAGGSRLALTDIHYFVGLTHLAHGRREAALRHLQRCADQRIFGNLNDAISRALLAQMDRDPGWPRRGLIERAAP